MMRYNFFYFVFFALILALTRIIPHPPNFTPILASAIMAPLLVKDRMIGVAIPILAMFISDILLGFHPFQFAIYFTIFTIGLASPMEKNYVKLGLMAIGGSVWFFITTNFAVWIILDSYPKTIEGLMTSYILAIPFFKNTIISTFLFTGIIVISMQYLDILSKKTNYLIINFIGKFVK